MEAFRQLYYTLMVLCELPARMWCVLCVYGLYTLNHKKRDILFLTTTLANLSRFL